MGELGTKAVASMESLATGATDLGTTSTSSTPTVKAEVTTCAPPSAVTSPVKPRRPRRGAEERRSLLLAVDGDPDASSCVAVGAISGWGEVTDPAALDRDLVTVLESGSTDRSPEEDPRCFLIGRKTWSTDRAAATVPRWNRSGRGENGKNGTRNNVLRKFTIPKIVFVKTGFKRELLNYTAICGIFHHLSFFPYI